MGIRTYVLVGIAAATFFHTPVKAKGKQPSAAVCTPTKASKGNVDYLKRTREITLEQIVRTQHTRICFWTGKRARKIMRTQQFDVKRRVFDKKSFQKFFVNSFKASITYYNSFAPHPIKSVNLVLGDLGEGRRSTISQTLVNSNLILGDVRRWHKMWSGNRRYLHNVTSIHEYAHVQTYAFGKEPKRMREFIGILFESIGLIKHYGFEAYVRNYERKLVESVELERITNQKRWSMAALRAMAYRFTVNLSNGLYHHKGRSAEKKLKAFAADLIANKYTSEQGFNDATRKQGITFGSTPLTFRTLQQHTTEELVRRFGRKK